MLNENEIRLVTAALVILLALAESSNHPDVPEIERLLLRLSGNPRLDSSPDQP